jgi:branched-chain amino acid transport system ATP-binding protein
MSALLSIEKVQKRFGGLVAVQDVSFTVKQGEVVGLLGPNGSGKSTLLNLVSGAAGITRGKIRLGEVTISGLGADRIAHCGVGRTFQLVRLAQGLSARDNVLLALAFGAKPIWGPAAQARADELLAEVGLDDPAGLVGEMNYIDQKKVELARAIACRPKLLLLDEWLSGLNPGELHEGMEVVERLARSGVTVILVEHIMSAVRRLCPRAVVMASGRLIADGATAEVLAHPEVVRAYLGGDDNA